MRVIKAKARQDRVYSIPFPVSIGIIDEEHLRTVSHIYSVLIG